MRILLLGAGPYQINTVQAIKNAGFKVYIADKNSNAPAFSYSDGYRIIDIIDRPAVLEYATELNVQGIIPLNDFATRSAFYASQKLNLRSSSLLTAICGNDKGLMRDVWSLEKIPQPNYLIFSSMQDLMGSLNKIKYPIVIKPTDCGGGGRGISVVRDQLELESAVKHASKYVNNSRLIAEEFKEGIEISVDSFVFGGVIYPILISDKIKADSKYRVATSIHYPSCLPETILEDIKGVCRCAIESLGIVNGVAHIELIYNDSSGKIDILEIGTRGGGGHVFSTIMREVTGVCGPTEYAKIACGLKPNLNITKNSGCVYRFFNPKQTGVIEKLAFPDWFCSEKNLIDYGFIAKEGDVYNGLVDSLCRIGYLVVRGENRNAAILNADFLEKQVEIIIK